jgi:PKD repeat protein
MPNLSPAAHFSGLDIKFTDKSTGSPTSWYWDFGDGTNSTIQNPEHIYSKVGNYKVKLIASNNIGTSTITATVPIIAT